MKKDTLSSAIALLSAGLASASWINDLEVVLRIIASVFSILGVIASVIIAIKAWYKKANADGKITSDEVDEGLNIIKDGTTKIKTEVDNAKETTEDKAKGDNQK